MEYMIATVGAATLTNALAGLQQTVQQMVDQGAVPVGGVTLFREGEDSYCAMQVVTKDGPRIVAPGSH